MVKSHLRILYLVLLNSCMCATSPHCENSSLTYSVLASYGTPTSTAVSARDSTDTVILLPSITVPSSDSACVRAQPLGIEQRDGFTVLRVGSRTISERSHGAAKLSFRTCWNIYFLFYNLKGISCVSAVAMLSRGNVLITKFFIRLIETNLI